MKSNKSLAMIVVAIIIVGVLAFQFMNHKGPFKREQIMKLYKI